MSNNPHNLPFQSKLDRWLTSINSLFENIPALEVSTTIVETITPEVFIPWEVYQNIYQISPDYLKEDQNRARSWRSLFRFASSFRVAICFAFSKS